MKINDLLNEAGNMPGLVNNPNGGALNWAKNKLGVGMKAKRARQAKTVSAYSYKKWVDTIGKLQTNGQFNKTGDQNTDFNAYMDQLESFTRKQFGLRNKDALNRFRVIAGNGGNPNKDSITRAFLQAFTDTDLQNAVGNNKSQSRQQQQQPQGQQQQQQPQNTGITQNQPVDTTVPRQVTQPGQKPIAGSSGQATATMAPQQQPLKATSVTGTVNDPYATDQSMSMGGRVNQKGQVVPGKQTPPPAPKNQTQQAQPATGSNTGIQNGSTVSYGGKTYKWVNNAWRANDGETLTGTDAEAATYTFRNPE